LDSCRGGGPEVSKHAYCRREGKSAKLVQRSGNSTDGHWNFGSGGGGSPAATICQLASLEQQWKEARLVELVTKMARGLRGVNDIGGEDRKRSKKRGNIITRSLRNKV